MSAVDRAAQLVRMHREDDAVAELDRALAANPKDASTRRMLVRVLGAQGNVARARVEVEELVRTGAKDDPSPWIELGHAYELAHRFEDALAAYDRASDSVPDSPLGPTEGGLRASRWGETALAIPRLREAVARGSKDPAVYHALGLCLVHAEELAEAKAVYKTGTEFEKDGAENWLGVATVALLENAPSEALAAYDAIIKKKPNYGAGHLGRAWAFIQLRRFEEAKRALARAEELGAPKSNLGKLRALLTSRESAAKSTEQAPAIP